jgi:hypothetical protein
MLSKPIREFTNDIFENTFVEPVNTQIKNSAILTPRDYYTKKIDLNKYKITDLRDILRYYKSAMQYRSIRNPYTTVQLKKIKEQYDFALSGNKKILIDRIESYFKKETSSVSIQKRIRGIITRHTLLLRGPGLKNRNECVNKSDFYTLEPVDEIIVENFFSYKDGKGFVYGFDIDSLKTLIKSKIHSIKNPYNRENMDFILPDIQKIVRCTPFVHKTGVQIIPTKPAVKERQPNQSQLNNNINNINNNNQITPRNLTAEFISHVGDTMIRMRQIRERPIQDRITALFMEVDQLGNYTQSSWFSQLETRDYIRYFRTLFDIWNYRAQLSFQTKQKICPIHDPFINVMYNRIQYNNLSANELQNLCLTVMEDLVYSGVDIDSRMIGTFHMLSALTVVSIPARTNLMWLYESIAY